jgi:hypothetical protein
MCGYGVVGVRFWHSDDYLRSFRGQTCNQAFSTNAPNRERKRRKRPIEHRFAIIGIRTATVIDEVNAHEIKKGTLSGDGSYVAQQGTEPKLLIAKAAGLEAFIPNGDAASLQVKQIQEWVAVPEPQEKLCSVKVLFR